MTDIDEKKAEELLSQSDDYVEEGLIDLGSEEARKELLDDPYFRKLNEITEKQRKILNTPVDIKKYFDDKGLPRYEGAIEDFKKDGINRYYFEMNPETGRRYDIPGLNPNDPDYKELYIEYMMLKERNPAQFEKILNWGESQ